MARLFCLMAGGVAFMIAWNSKRLISDDVYIVMQYAENLIEHGKWSFNSIDISNGVSCPLYLMLVSLGGLVWRDLEVVVMAVNIMVWALWGGLTFKLLLSVLEDEWLGLFGALFVIATPLFPPIFGMETILVLTLQVSALISFLGRRYYLVGLWLGLAFLARPDSILMMVAIYFCTVLIEKRILLSTATVFCLVALPWAVFSWAYFGSPIPLTLSAKEAQLGWGYWKMSFLRGIVWNCWQYYKAAPLVLIVCSAILVPGFARLKQQVQRGNAGRFLSLQVILATYMVLYVAAYWLILGIPTYDWYYTPLIYYGSVFTLNMVRPAQFASETSRLVMIVLAAILAVQNYVANPALSRSLREPQKITGYKEIAEYIKNNSDSDATIGAMEVGCLAYYSKRQVIDMLGLDNRKRAEWIKKQEPGIWLAKSLPDFVVEGWAGSLIMKATVCHYWEEIPWFRAFYELDRKWTHIGIEQKLYRKIRTDDQMVWPSGPPTVGFCLDHDDDLLLFHVTKHWSKMIRSAKKVGPVRMEAVPRTAMPEGNVKACGDCGSSQISFLTIRHLAPLFNSEPRGKFFLLMDIEAAVPSQGQQAACCGKLLLTPNKRNPTGTLSIAFRLLRDGQRHRYYIPLFGKREWLHPADIADVAMCPSPIPGRIHIGEMELAMFEIK